MFSAMPSVALVGVAHIHTPGFIDALNQRGFTVPVVYDHESERGNQRAGTLPGSRFVTADELLAEEVDGYVVCTETDRHVEWVEKLAAKGKPLFVEKPLGFAGADAVKMADAIQAAGVAFQTGYFSRSIPEIRQIKALVDSGALGQITRVRGSNCHSGALGRWFDTDWRWMADPKVAGVGAFGDLGTHSLDILLWIFGPAESVTGQLSNGTEAYEGCDETGEALIRFKSGVIGTLAAAWDDVANPVSYLVSGTKGHAAIIDGKLVVNGAEAPTVEAVSGGFGAFLDHLEGKPTELVTAREAAERSVTMEAIYIGAQEGRWVSL
jgi:predicted dehydrogenase